MKAIVHHFPVQLNGATSDILGACGVNLRLDGHVLKVNVIDLEKEDFLKRVIVEADLPFKVIVR